LGKDFSGPGGRRNCILAAGVQRRYGCYSRAAYTRVD